VEKYCRAGQATDDSIIQRVCFACCIIEAAHTHTHTHTEYAINVYGFSMATVVTRTRLYITFIRTLHLLFRLRVDAEGRKHFFCFRRQLV